MDFQFFLAVFWLLATQSAIAHIDFDIHRRWKGQYLDTDPEYQKLLKLNAVTAPFPVKNPEALASELLNINGKMGNQLNSR
ncbi:hypothetical protein Y032_0739g1964 [Ancylostoma ceylanicum]|nr:hypothetical protein Y032_0739g1964 [Ancylostoma ceylanicum]